MQSILSQWNFSINSIVLVIVLCAVYFYAIHFRFTKQSLYFFASLFIIIICIASPLHFVGEHYLFSAHMSSHVLLLLIAAPMLVFALPPENAFKKQLVFFSKKIYNAPLLSWLAGVCIMWFWHVPFIFNQLMPMAGMQSGGISMDILMSVHTISLLIAGVLFCWPVINPYKQYRLASLTSVLYLASACVCCSLLGLLITFAPAGTYTGYISSDSNAFLSIVRNQWKISTGADQQMAGLIMWVPCCFIYLTASMVILIKWFGEKDVITRIESNYSNSGLL